MPPLTLDLALGDLLGFLTVVAGVLLAYGRLRSELRHLDDTKTERREMYAFAEDIRARLEELRTSMIRLETVLRSQMSPVRQDPPQQPD